MKILKDLQSKRDVKPIFLRSLASGNEEVEQYPNFKAEEEFQSNQPRVKKPLPYKSDRFNETLTGVVIGNAKKNKVITAINVDKCS
jgi:hypothetical protein